MSKRMREVIEINEALCNGCGQCVSACAEGALQLVNGKARLVREDYCDGLGACLGDCPTGALKMVQRPAEEFNHPTLKMPAGHASAHAPGPAHAGGACPGSVQRVMARPAARADGPAAASELTHWPIQLRLVNPAAAVFQGADLLFAADCSAFALGSFHADLLRGRKVIIACPKLDDMEADFEKIKELLAAARPASITVARMEVPCCRGLTQCITAAAQAVNAAAPVRELVITIAGECQSPARVPAAGAGCPMSGLK